MQLVSLNDIKVLLREYIKKSSRIGSFLSTYDTNGQLTSLAAEGLAPFSVVSNTMVAGLNADMLDGHHASDFVTTMDTVDTIVLETIDDRVANTLLRDTPAITWTYDDAANAITPTINHAGLAGLTEDDHAQYIRTDGHRNFVGDQRFEMDVRVDQNLSVGTFTMANGAVNGYVLRTDNLGNANWEPDPAPGHGSLTGLTGDDHPQYLKTDGSRICTGNQTFSADVIVDDWLTVGHFKMPIGAIPGRVLGCNAAGVGTWQELINEHSGLGGLTDDDHPQYVYIYGRGGGQTIVGGLVAAENLSLQSTAHATRGRILFGSTSAYNDANGRLGIGTISPAYSIDVVGTVRATGFIMPTGAATGYVLSTDATGISSWGLVPSGVVDHGTVLGLSDDDHTQYSRADGTRAFTGTVVGVNPTLGTHLSTKDYVDSIVAASGAAADHGALLGLSDDDHTQYLLVDGTRNSTGDQIFEQSVFVQNSGVVENDFRVYDNHYGATIFARGGILANTVRSEGVGTKLSITTKSTHSSPIGEEGMATTDVSTGSVVLQPGMYAPGAARQGSITLSGHIAGASVAGDVIILGGTDHATPPGRPGASVVGGDVVLYSGRGNPGGDILLRAGGGWGSAPAGFRIYNGGNVWITAGDHDESGGTPGSIYLTTAGSQAEVINEFNDRITRNLLVEGSGHISGNFRSDNDIYAAHFYGDGAGLGGLIVDHGDLNGLTDDDHAQYLRTDGTRNSTGDQTFEQDITVNGNVYTSLLEPSAVGTSLSIATQSELVGAQTGSITIRPGYTLPYTAWNGTTSIVLAGINVGGSTAGAGMTITGGIGKPAGDIVISAGDGRSGPPGATGADGGQIRIESGDAQAGTTPAASGDITFMRGGDFAGRFGDIFEVQQDIHASGYIYATRFYGDGGGVTGVSHDGLAGLGDDDHLQYLLADGSRSATRLDVTTSGVFGDDVWIIGDATLQRVIASSTISGTSITASDKLISTQLFGSYGATSSNLSIRTMYGGGPTGSITISSGGIASANSPGWSTDAITIPSMQSGVTANIDIRGHGFTSGGAISQKAGGVVITGGSADNSVAGSSGPGGDVSIVGGKGAQNGGVGGAVILDTTTSPAPGMIYAKIQGVDKFRVRSTGVEFIDPITTSGIIIPGSGTISGDFRSEGDIYADRFYGDGTNLDIAVYDTDIVADEDLKKRQISIILDGGGVEITTGDKKTYTRIPYDFEVEGCEIVADVSGSIVVDLWKDTIENFPPTVLDTVTGAWKPQLAGGIYNQADDLVSSGWVTTWNEGDYINACVDSVSTVTKAVVNIYGNII